MCFFGPTIGLRWLDGAIACSNDQMVVFEQTDVVCVVYCMVELSLFSRVFHFVPFLCSLFQWFCLSLH